jgi:hypothetical protein
MCALTIIPSCEVVGQVLGLRLPGATPLVFGALAATVGTVAHLRQGLPLLTADHARAQFALAPRY